MTRNPVSLINTILHNIHYLIPSSTRIGYLGWIGYGNLGVEALYEAFKILYKQCLVVPFKYTEKIEAFEKHILRRKLYQFVTLGGGTLINHDAFLDRFQALQHHYPHTIAFGSGVRNPELWDRNSTNYSRLSEWKECLQA